MYQSNDAIYYSSATDNWSGTNSGYIETYSDLLGTSTTRSHMSHIPLHPPQSARFSSNDSTANGGDHVYHGNHRHKTSNSEYDASRSHSRHRTAQMHPQTVRSSVNVPRWNPISTARQTSTSQSLSDCYSPSSPSSYPAALSHNPHNRSKNFSHSSRTSSQTSVAPLFNRPNLMSVVTTPTNTKLATIESLKKELDIEQKTLATIVWEKKKLEGREARCHGQIAKLQGEIKALSASVAASTASASAGSTNALPVRNVILFPPLSLKYNLPPSCDILPVSTFMPVHGFRGQFEAPPALGDPSLKILLRICNLNREKSIQSDHINCKFEIIVNNIIVHAGKKKPHRGPLDITSSCSGYQNSVEIKITTAPAGSVDEPLPKEAVVQIVYAYKLEATASVAALNSDKYQRPQVTTEQLIKSKFSNECEIVDESDLKVSLTCQITKARLTLPCTGVNCTHLTYFNGDTFLNMYHSKDDWSCPICRLPIGMDELRVDSLLKKILKESSSQTLEVSFDRHAKWAESLECKKEIVKEMNHNNSIATSKQKPKIDVITIDDSDDDDALPPPPPQATIPHPVASASSSARPAPLTLKIRKPPSLINQVSSRASSSTSSSDSDSNISPPHSRGGQPKNLKGKKRAHSPESDEDTDLCLSWSEGTSQSSDEASESSDSSSSSSPSQPSPVIRQTRSKAAPSRHSTRRK